MKLSIAILSSILLAFSVTVANPVLDSSTTSTATTTSSAYPSATETSGTSHSTLLDPYSLYMDHCYPISFSVLGMIELLASNAHKLEELSQDIENKRARFGKQKKVIDELKEKLGNLKSDPSSSKSEIAKLESTLTNRNKASKKLWIDLGILFKKHSAICQEITKLRRQLKDYFRRHHPIETMNTGGGPYLNRYPVFTSCFNYYYSRSPQ
ncbi:hypothetical protein BATDEDRAFT_28318 [Batrachochytrium dendrobatidis JAM81]|uniref:Uncharacterized protein n=1 Tax=Batrachochytrium dendrobatidis (strain JAM81 / FGSC 10211) TaxID=684364 RepID=F4PDN9_BATDJ|nr:uncharacterized protein BATDEDRAFT_28318 [Batrachochytrium dendrobatidis JAM81]EGF76816.1 hypothetical protein BATDEDRAFT_28318 [Batrachochytrium dendrobatidis JAM81]|eukprot:XP_006682625.1 hypothetical protein BATDEDRAFT_28318 [Batrachochytrium dendrobatidis JAM81]